MRNRIAVGLATVLAVVLGAADLLQHYDVPASLALPLSLLRVLPWALLLADPRAAWAGSLLATYATAAAGDPVGPAEPWPWAVTSVLAALPVAAVCGARLPRRVTAGFAASVPATGAVALLAGRGDWTGLVAPTVLLGIAFAAGDLVRGRREARAGLTVERDRREALEERARIAREMHDVVAHGLALVTVRADSAPARLGGVPAEVSAEFAGIAEAARTTLTELRGLLDVLRGGSAATGGDADGPGGPAATRAGADGTGGPAATRAGADGPGGALAPQPGLADLAALAESSRAAGVPVRLTVTADGTGLPPGVQLTAYRLVQEALSNVLRHAPGRAADVTVARAGGELRITVTNEGPAGPPGTGHGLVGMRERVAAVGGTVSAGPAPGGWRVDATLPA